MGVTVGSDLAQGPLTCRIWALKYKLAFCVTDDDYEDIESFRDHACTATPSAL